MMAIKVQFSTYGAQYSYDRTECTGCEDYCRCTQIINASVTSVGDALSMINFFEDNKRDRYKPDWNKGKFKPSIMVQYAVDRLFRIYRLYDPSKWSVKVTGGYYGEEVDGVELDDSQLAKKFLDDVQKLLTMDDLPMVKYVLEAEYKYIHDSIADVTECKLVQLDADSLGRQTEHFSRVKNHDIIDYKMIEGLPIGVVYNDTRLIDGYHRLAQAGPGVHTFIGIYS